MARRLWTLALLLLAQYTRAVAPFPRGNGFIAASDQEDCEPRQVHIALGSDPSQMHLTWRTAGANCPSEVSWWHDTWAGALLPGGASNAVGSSFLLSERDMCAAPAASNAFSAHLHRAALSGLRPGAAYRYRVGGGGGGRQQAFGFRTQPAPGPRARAEFVLFGDHGHQDADSPGAPATIETLRRLEVDRTGFIGLVGDVSYGDGNPDIWDLYMDSIQPVASRVPWMVTAGNHDYSQGGGLSDPSRARGPYHPDWANYGRDSGGECGVQLARRFHMPSATDGGVAASPAAAGGADAPLSPPSAPPADNAPFWYAFTHGPVRFVAVSTEHDLSPSSQQHAWLAHTLAAVDRCAAPWVVVLAHRPLYVSAEKSSNRRVAEHLRAQLEGLLLEHRVDAVVSGHVHTYYRSCPLADGECVSTGTTNSRHNISSQTSPSSRRAPSPPHGIVHLVVGSAGRRLSGIADPREDRWVAKALEEYGYTRFAVDGPHKMSVEFVASEGGDVLDSFEIVASPARRALACARSGGGGGAAAQNAG